MRVSAAGRMLVPDRKPSGAITLAAALCLSVMGALAQTGPQGPAPDTAKSDAAKYPDWSGQWRRPESGPNRYDPSKPPGRAQQAPLTPEYQAIFEAGLADQKEGGSGTNMTSSCLPSGEPRDMSGNQGLEFVITPKITYVLFDNAMPRRIYTDGRSWPENEEPSFAGYSIGTWSEVGADGRYGVLEVETRNFTGPRTFDNAGIPLHPDNQTVLKERIWRDPANAGVMHNEMTTFDHALTRPWTVHKTYRLEKTPVWIDNICTVGNQHVQIGKDGYYLSADGYLMPLKKGQPPPDLRYFNQAKQ
jgi:hypothetical protein